jgi:hypothetical protein
VRGCLRPTPEAIPGVTATLPGGRLVYGASRSRRPTPQTLTISLWVGLASFARSRQAWLIFSGREVGPVVVDEGR